VRRLGVVAITVAGVVVIAQGLALLPQSTWLLQAYTPLDRTTLLSFILYAVAVAVIVMFGGLLIVRREHLAARWFDETDADLALDALGLLRAGLIVVGVGLLMQGVTRLLAAASSTVSAFTYQAMPEYGGLQVVDWTSIAVHGLIGVVLFAAGALLMTRSDPFASRLWSGKTPQPESQRGGSTCPVCGAAYDPAEYRDPASARCDQCGSELNSSSA